MPRYPPAEHGRIIFFNDGDGDGNNGNGNGNGNGLCGEQLFWGAFFAIGAGGLRGQPAR